MQKRVFTVWNEFSLDWLCVARLTRLLLLVGVFILRSVYFTENSGYRSLKNRSCVTVFGSCSATLTVGEPIGDVSGSANHDFRTSVTGISGEIDTSFILLIKH